MSFTGEISTIEILSTPFQVLGFPKYFNIGYEGDKDEEDKAFYTYRLLEDMEAGDLKILL